MTRSPSTLQQLLESVTCLAVRGDLSQAPSALRTDSRLVEPGDLFFALTGQQVDGHDFLAQATARGALAAVVSQEFDSLSEPLPPVLVRVADTAVALASLAAAFYGQPSAAFRLVGITGTNGKTTLTYLLEGILLAAGSSPAVIGTVETRFLDQREDNPFTTPQAAELQALFRRMADHGVDCVLMEVSSHALSLDRVRASQFQVGVFTNLSRDHLDFHGDLESYAQAKSLLFGRELAASGAADKVAVINADDARAESMLRAYNGRVIRYGMKDSWDVHPSGQVVGDLSGTRCQVDCPAGRVEIDSRLTGRHNLENLLAAVAVACALRIGTDAIGRGLAAVEFIPGRLERVDGGGEGPAVFVDYAHTDHALQNVLAALGALTPGRLVTVFGCGGDRDRGKRPLMGAAVAAGSDLAVVTSDNPRSEDPQAIIDGILPGLEKGGFVRIEPAALAESAAGHYCVEADRSRAISLAIGLAGPKDVVLIAGKGHEAYQIVGDRRLDFDDRQQARQAIARRHSEVAS